MGSRILLVDDHPTLREVIASHLAIHHQVTAVGSSTQALALLCDGPPYDLVIADSHMPEMGGPELIEEARKRCPGIRYALLSGCSMEECIHFSTRYGIGNIIAKTIPLNLEEIERMVSGLLTEEVFGLARYMSPDAECREYRVRRSRDIARIRDKILDKPDFASWAPGKKLMLKLVLDEAISNAAYHSNQIHKGRDVSLAEYQEVRVLFGKDAEKIGISVVDQAGRLTKEDILARLDRCMNQAEDYLFSDSGRGLYIIQTLADRLIINIKKGELTEIIMLIYHHRREIGHRPLFIHEM